MAFELESHHRNVPDDDLLAELRRVAVLVNRTSVTIDEFNDNAKYHSSTLARRFGSGSAYKPIDICASSY